MNRPTILQSLKSWLWSKFYNALFNLLTFPKTLHIYIFKIIFVHYKIFKEIPLKSLMCSTLSNPSNVKHRGSF